MSRRRKTLIQPASKIREKARGNGMVDDLAADNLLVIETDIEKAMNNGADKSVTEIATSFSIPPMTREDAQRAVYYRILKELRDAEYTPRIEFRGKKEGEQRVFMHVKWVKPTEEDQKQVMNEYIAKHQFKEIAAAPSGSGPRRRRRK